ncbi:MAG: hypothetical protein RLZZ450_715 [Pseudomonadota bacterium]|jgi:hypothetical protein
MKSPTLATALLSLSFACQHAGSERLVGRVLERGGELGDVTVAQTNVTVSKSAITVWGVMEVPAGARMQAAYAGVDAIARAELLKVIRVRVADVMVSVESTKPAETTAFEHTFEAVKGVIRHAEAPLHGWERVLRGDETILRIWARLTVPRADLESSLQAVQGAGDVALPADILDELSSSTSSKSTER